MDQDVKLNIITKSPETKIISLPLVFIHGMFQGSWVYEEHFLEYFVEKGFECHLLNLRGHNGSTHKGAFRFVTIKNYIEDLTSVIDSLPEKPILIGHSMGGFIIQKYLEKNEIPLNFLIATVPPKGVIRPTLKVMVNAPFRFLLANLTLNLQPIVNSKKLMKKLFYQDSTSEELFERFYNKHQNESYLAYLQMLMFSWVKTKKIKSNLEILGFENDYSISANSVRKTAKKYGVEPKIFPDRGHCPMIEPGWEEVADYIIEKIKTSGVNELSS